MTKQGIRTKILLLVMILVIICVVAAGAMAYARLPDISAETTVPLVFEVRGRSQRSLLGAWQPEKATLEIGDRSIATADMQKRNAQYFSRLPGTGKLAWWSGNANATIVKDKLSLKSLNSSVVVPLTSYPPVGAATVWWWSGHGVSVTTARVEYRTTTALSLHIMHRLFISDATGKTCTADLPQNLVMEDGFAAVISTAGNLQDGFVLLQGYGRDMQKESLFLVRLQNGKAVTHEVAHDSNYDPKDGSTWILEPASDPPDWACAGTILYLCPRASYGKSNRIWTLDINAAHPTVRLEQNLTSLADSLPSTYPLVALGPVERFSLSASGPYLLLSNGNSDVWALRNDKVVGHLHRNAGTISADAGTQSVKRRVRDLYQLHLPNAADLGNFFLAGY